MIRCALLRGEPELDPASFLCPEEAGLLGPRAVPKRRSDFHRGRFIAKKLLTLAFPDSGPLDHCVLPDDRGVPMAHDRSGHVRPVSLSLTHTPGYAAAAVVAAPLKVGIDAERSIENRELVTANFFTERENAMVRASGEPGRVATTIWSAKEAVTKAMGEGLRVPLLSIEIIRIAEPGTDGWRTVDLEPLQDWGTLPAWAWNEGDCVVVVVVSERHAGIRPKWVIEV